MKVLCQQIDEGNIVLDAIDDSLDINIFDDGAYYKNQKCNFLNPENSIVYEGVIDVPEDFERYKYFYDGTTWSLNPNF